MCCECPININITHIKQPTNHVSPLNAPITLCNQGRIKLLGGPMPKTFGGPFSLRVIGNRAIRQVINDFLLVFNYNDVSILHHFRDINYFPNLKKGHVTVNTPT